eukprot:m.311018 g.311018  ORF g.311018 m.311018 type:complete len:398 (+) comp58150_c0_seq1:73-1266(+)
MISHSDRQRTMTTNANKRAKPSQLEEIRRQFETRALREKEQKMVALYKRQQQRALERVAKTFRRQASCSEFTGSIANSSESATAMKPPKPRAVVAGRHNVLEPLQKAILPKGLPRPARPNDRYGRRGEMTPPAAMKPGLARPHLLLRHAKLPAVGSTGRPASEVDVRRERKNDGVVVGGRGSVTLAVAKKQREILLQLKRRETALGLLQKQTKEFKCSAGDDVNESSVPTRTERRPERIDDDGRDDSSALDLVACPICSRKFASDRLEKHTKICSRTNQKKRKVFNSSKMRVRGTELEQFRPINKSRLPEKENRPKQNWRRQHEEFIEAIRAAKKVQDHIKRGGKLSDLPPPPPSENPNYVQCLYCLRRFNPATAERHIPKCKDTKHRPAPPKSKRR